MAKAAWAEIGKTGLKWSYGYVSEEFLTSLQGSKGLKIYREMSDNDSIVGACLFAIKQILRESRWAVRSGDEADAACNADAKFLEDNMASMTHSWTEFISDILSMLIYGWSYFEQVFEFRKRDNKVVWKKIAHRKQSSMERWEIDDVGEVVGLWQRPAPDYKLIYLPMKKSLLFRTESAGNNPEGRSILRNAYRAWYFKKNIEEIEGIGIERDLAGLPILKPPENFKMDSDSDETKVALKWAKDIVSSIRRDEQDGILLPFGWEFELVGSPGKRQFDTTTTVNRYNKEIAVTVLAQFVMLGMERTGSYALAKEQTDMFYLCLEGWADAIATSFNRQAIPTLFGLNGVSAEMRPLPYVVHTNIHRYSLRDLAYYVSSLAKDDCLVVDDDIKNYLKQYARLSEFKDMKK